MPKVHIVILNYNGWRDTLDCLASLQNLDYPDYEVVVVDNASADDSERKIRAAYPGVKVLQSGANLGFAGGNNVGMKDALEKADYLWLLNNDTVVDAKALSALVDEASSDLKIGMVGSKIYYFDEPEVIWFAGGKVSLRSGATAHLGMNQPDHGQWDNPADIDYATACSVLVSAPMIREVGLMDETFFLYYEEVDWACRARRRGWKIRYAPTSRVWHKVSKSAGLNSPLTMFHCSRSLFIFARKHISSLPLAALYPALRHFILPRLARGRFDLTAACLKGMVAGARCPLKP